jgi:hypothetical protein
MSFPTIPYPREHDQVIIEMFFSHDLRMDTIKSLGRCRGVMKTIFLSDKSTADGRYLEHFVFDPGTITARSTPKREAHQEQLGSLDKLLA